MNYRFNGSFSAWPKLHGKTGPRGVLKHMKSQRRAEAEFRNARTPHNRTKRHRLYCPGECD